MLKEFKEFAMRGNVLDMAVGIIIGAAFGKIVSSLVDDIIMPPIGRALGQVDFSNLFINLGSTTYPTIAAAKAAGQPTLNYGLFLNTVITFLIIGLPFFFIAHRESLARKPAPGCAARDCPQCAMRFRS
jgi:large conductance mechanosensitive channel